MIAASDPSLLVSAGRSKSAATALFIVGLAATQGCTTHQCDPSHYDYYGGHMVGPDLFVTNDLDAPWISFPPSGTITIWMPPAAAGRVLAFQQEDIATGPTPNGGPDFADGDTYTTAAGQLVNYTAFNTSAVTTDAGTFGGSFQVTNATCATYFARFTVQFAPQGSAENENPTGAGSDNGGPSDAADDGGPSDVADDAETVAP